MKTLFTLFLATVLSLSLMGQQDINGINELTKLKEQSDAIKSLSNNAALERENPRIQNYLSRHLFTQHGDLQGSALKARAASVQKMDSTLYHLYDAGSAAWILSDRDLFSYDANGNMTTYIWYAYDSVKMEILPYDKETVKYDEAGNVTEVIWFIWDIETGQWVNYGKFDFSYDAHGNMTGQTIYEWDPVHSQWLEGIRSEMTYDGSGNTLSTLWYSWDEDSAKLALVLKEEYLYENGQLTTLNEYASEEGVWELYYRTLYTYDDAGNLIEELSQFWEPENGEWFDFYQTLYTYDENNRLILEEEWEFSFTAFGLAQSWQYEYTWDADGNMTESVERGWYEEIVKGTNSWINVSKSVWSFNKDVPIEDLAVPYWFFMEDADMNFVHMPLTEMVYFYDGDSWMMESRMTAYYSDLGSSTGIGQSPEAEVTIFPVPASENITFSWDDSYTQLRLDLYDLAGKRVISRDVNNSETIDVNQLSNGVFLYKLSDKNNLIHSGKISIR